MYTVTVAVGDAGTAVDSVHWLNIEDQNAIAGVRADRDGTKFATATRTVRVTDGRLTLSPAGGTNTKFDYVDIASVPGAGAIPGRAHQHAGQPAPPASPPTTSVVEDLVLPNGGVDHGHADRIDGDADPARATARRCRPTRSPAAAATWSTSPRPRRWPRTRLPVQPRPRACTDVTGKPFAPYSIVFTTGSGGGTGGPVAFDKVVGVATGASFTTVVKGPDGRLYAGTLDGDIYRFPINADGTLGTADGHQHGPRRTPPRSACPARRPARSSGWRSTRRPRRPRRSCGSPTTTSTSARSNVPDWSGRIGRLTGADLGTYTSEVVEPAALGQGPRDQLARLRPGRRALPHPGRQQRHGRRRLHLGQPARAAAHRRRAAARPGPAAGDAAAERQDRGGRHATTRTPPARR